jgi:hypothetical protein
MNGLTDTSESIDRKTSRSICDAVGERLRQNLRPESSRLPPQLQKLMDRLHQREAEGSWGQPGAWPSGRG